MFTPSKFLSKNEYNYEDTGCSTNNDSKSCPVMLCNFEKSAIENSKI